MRNQVVKKIGMLGVFMIHAFFGFSQIKGDRILPATILSVPFNKYVNKEVYQLLLNDTIRTYKEFLFIDSKPGLLNGAMIVIEDNFYLEIFISDFRFVNQFDEFRKWNKMLFCKETISRIKVYQNNKCKFDTGEVKK